jgi:dTDP-4-amino-4,6-dideoxygalactose transaminase
MPIPLLDLQAQYSPIRDEILAAVTRVCDSQQLILGAEVEALERELAGFIGVPHAVAVSSGTDALLVALMAIGVQAGDEVVTTPYSFFATASSIARLGARPVFVDIDPVTFNIDPERVAAAITAQTKAILPVHLFGLAADLESIVDIAARAGVPIIEDAAQAIGASYGSRHVGSFGAFGCFSFYPSKNLGAFGDAGLLTTNDEVLAARVRLLRNQGMQPRYHHHLLGGNFRMDALQAAVLRVKAPRLTAWTEARRGNAETYRTLFRQAKLEGSVTVPTEPAGRRHIFNQFVIRVADRDRLKRYLDTCGIGNEIYYPVPLHLQPCFAHLGYKRGDFPNAERAAEETLALPIYAELTDQQQAAVVRAIADFLRGEIGN